MDRSTCQSNEQLGDLRFQARNALPGQRHTMNKREQICNLALIIDFWSILFAWIRTSKSRGWSDSHKASGQCQFPFESSPRNKDMDIGVHREILEQHTNLRGYLGA